MSQLCSFIIYFDTTTSSCITCERVFSDARESDMMRKASAISEGRNHDLLMTLLNSLSAVQHSRVKSRLETWTCEISLNNKSPGFVSAYKHNSSLRNCQDLPRTHHIDINTSSKLATRPIDLRVIYESTQTCYLLPSHQWSRDIGRRLRINTCRAGGGGKGEEACIVLPCMSTTATMQSRAHHLHPAPYVRFGIYWRPPDSACHPSLCLSTVTAI